jgi:CRISPR-associated protein Csy2
MNTCPRFSHLLVLPHLRVQNANAVSGPLTHGFPPVTAFLGLMWALERKARAAGLDTAFQAVGVVCHAYQEQISQKGLCLTRNSLLTREEAKKVDRTGRFETPSIVEEGRIHLELSLVFALHSERWNNALQETIDSDIAQVKTWLEDMRVAGGIVLPSTQPKRSRYQPFHVNLTGTEDDQQTEFGKARMRLLPGFTLVARDELLDARQADLLKSNGKTMRLDAWLSLARVNWHYQPDPKDGTGQWLHDRKDLGWIVPVPVGYGALSKVYPPGSVANARDAVTPFCFVESLYSVGQWVSPHRLQSAQQMLWYADSQPGNGLYRCRNDYRPAQSVTESLDDSD